MGSSVLDLEDNVAQSLHPAEEEVESRYVQVHLHHAEETSLLRTRAPVILMLQGPCI